MSIRSRFSLLFRTYARLVAVLAILLGLAVVLDWRWGLTSIDHWLPLFLPMSGFSATCTFFAGLSLLGVLMLPAGSRWRWASRVCALIIIAVAAYNLVSLIPIADVWSGLVNKAPSDRLRYTRNGPMTPAGAYTFALIAIALLLVSVERRSLRFFGQLLAMVVTILALLGMSGYIYVAQSPSALSVFISMALPTALVGTFLGLALVFSVPEIGIIQVFMRDSNGGRMSRRLIPAMLALQLLVEFLRFRQSASAFYEEPFGLQILFALSPFAILLLVAYAAQSIDRSDEERQKALDDLSRLNADLERRVAERTSELGMANRKLLQEIRERKFLEREMSEIREKLEERLGRMVHDGIAQDLTGITFSLKALEDTATERGDDPQSIRDIRMNLIDCCRAAKDLARQIYPPELEAGELVASLEELAAHTEVRHELRCRFSGEAREEALDRETAEHLFYIAQEAVKNAVRHGAPRSIEIKLVHEGPALSLEIFDDGKGFVLGEQGGGVGLRIIRHRARALQAQLDIHTSPNKGTRIHCRLPVREFSPEEPA